MHGFTTVYARRGWVNFELAKVVKINLALTLQHGQKGRGSDDRYARKGTEDEQVLIATDNHIRLAGHGNLEELVVEGHSPEC